MKHLNRVAVVCILCVAFIFTTGLCASAAEKSTSTPGKININKADVEKLTELKGIGDIIAARIVEYRTKNGPFKAPEDLMKVKGIGEKTFEKIKGRIIVGKK